MSKKRREEPPLPSVSDSELEVLKVLWERGPLAPADLHDALSTGSNPWAYTTVQTFLHRLHVKGYVTRERQGRAWVYEPIHTQTEVLANHVDRELRRVGATESSTLLLGLIDSKRLSRSDIAHLRRVLDEAESSLGDKKSKEP